MEANIQDGVDGEGMCVWWWRCDDCRVAALRATTGHPPDRWTTGHNQVAARHAVSHHRVIAKIDPRVRTNDAGLLCYRLPNGKLWKIAVSAPGGQSKTLNPI